MSLPAGDIIVLGTDGLLDNMYSEQIGDVIKKGALEGVNPEQLAWDFAELALYNPMDKYLYSPFAKAAQLAGKKHMGGKIDDIMVLLPTFYHEFSLAVLFCFLFYFSYM